MTRNDVLLERELNRTPIDGMYFKITECRVYRKFELGSGKYKLFPVFPIFLLGDHCFPQNDMLNLYDEVKDD